MIKNRRNSLIISNLGGGGLRPESPSRKNDTLVVPAAPYYINARKAPIAKPGGLAAGAFFVSFSLAAAQRRASIVLKPEILKLAN